MLKKIWRDPVWSAVIAAAIVAGGSYFAGLWPPIWQLVKATPSFLVTPVSMPLWLVILLVPALIIVIPLLKSFKSVREPGFSSYTSDSLFDINWSWRWLPPGFYDSHYRITDLTPRCPSCHAILSINDYRSPLVSCENENCNWRWVRQNRHGSRIGHSTELDSKVRNEIDRRIHAGERGKG